MGKLRDLSAKLQVVSDERLCVGLAGDDFVGHGRAAIRADEIFAVRHDDVQSERVCANFGADAIDEGVCGAKRLAGSLDRHMIDLAAIMEEREKDVEHDFRVALAANARTKKFGDALDKACAHLGERAYGSCLREEPLAVAKWVGIFWPESAYGRVPNVPDDHVCTEVTRDFVS